MYKNFPHDFSSLAEFRETMSRVWLHHISREIPRSGKYRKSVRVNTWIDATQLIANHEKRAARACAIVHIVPVRCIAFYYRTGGVERERDGKRREKMVYTQIYKYISNSLQAESETSN